jgi:hypothetical protein
VAAGRWTRERFQRTNAQAVLTTASHTMMATACTDGIDSPSSAAPTASRIAAPADIDNVVTSSGSAPTRRLMPRPRTAEAVFDPRPTRAAVMPTTVAPSDPVK